MMRRRPSIGRSLIALLLACTAAATSVASAQDDITPEQRTAYYKGLDEARKLINGKQWTSAAERLDKLLAERPREAQARFLKGVVQTEQGKTEEAMHTFEDLIADYPEIPEPYNNLAVIYAQKGELENARVTLELAVKTAPNWAVAQENLGDIYARIAAEHYGRAVTLDKTSKSAAAKLALARQLATTSAPARPTSAAK
jgi:Flp pilus assembly protein TadD